jgi:heme exporter protein D
MAPGHAAFILAAYAVAVAIVAGLIAWVVVDHRAQRRLLADLELRGLRRRSERAKEQA